MSALSSQSHTRGKCPHDPQHIHSIPNRVEFNSGTPFPPHSKNPFHFESSNGGLFSHPQRMVPEAKEKNEKKEKVGKQTKKGSNWKSMKSMILRNPIESKKKWIKHRVHYD